MSNKKQKDTLVSPQGKQLGENAFCVHSLRLFLPAQKKEVKRRWLDQHDLWVAEISGVQRVFTPVVLAGMLLWMDAVTGSVYLGNGRSMTSAVLNIKISSVLQNKAKAEEMLMALSVKEELEVL